MFTINKEDKIFKAHIMDKHKECYDRDYHTVTRFLNLNEQTVVMQMKNEFRVPFKLWGGFDDAERKILCFLPSWADDNLSDFLKIVKVSHSGRKTLSHRDYLGSLLSIGISRDAVGDIWVSEYYAHIIVKSEMADFIKMNYDKAGRVSLFGEILGIENISVPLYNIKEVKDTVSSLRLDAVVASAFSMSRGNAAEHISAGNVYVNDMLTTKTDFKVSEGSKIKVHRRGRAILKEIGGLSRKDRIFVTFDLYM